MLALKDAMSFSLIGFPFKDILVKFVRLVSGVILLIRLSLNSKLVKFVSLASGVISLI